MNETAKCSKTKIPFFILNLWPLSCLSVLLCCCTIPDIKDHTAAYKKIDSVKQLLRSGDLIVRNGTDEVSQAARKFNRKDTTYSHCGIIQIENDTAVVYHSLGGSFNPSQQLMRQVLDHFCDPADIDKFAVYRYPFSKQENAALSELVHWHYNNKLLFDLFFNFETDDKMYCSEFVFKTFDSISTHYFLNNLPRTNPMYVTIDDLFLNARVKLITRIGF